MGSPNRWLHVRIGRKFTAEEFERFRAHTELWRAMVEAHLARWRRLGFDYDPPAYEFFDPVLSEDGCVATLPVGGEWSIGTRSLFENSFSHFLWMHFPIALQMEAEEGITETIGQPPPVTNWRPALIREPAPRSLGSIDPAFELLVRPRTSRLGRVLAWLGEIAPRG